MAGAEEGQQKAAKLINDLQEISVLEIGFVIVATWVTIYVVRRVFPYLAQRGPNQARLYILGAVPIIRLVLLIVATLWIVPIIFNITFQNFLVVAGAASVAIGFAFKDYVTSIIAGVVAIFERPYRPGDWVEIEGDYGEVQSVGMRAIRLVTAEDNVVTVPHMRIWDHNISNSNDGSRTLMCVAHFYLAPDHDAGAVRKGLIDVALTSAFLEYEKPVIVVLVETPYGTHYQLKAYPFDLRDQFAFVSDLTERGKIAVARAGARPVTAPVAGEAVAP